MIPTEEKTLEKREEFQIRAEQRNVQNQKEMVKYNITYKEDRELERIDIEQANYDKVLADLKPSMLEAIRSGEGSAIEPGKDGKSNSMAMRLLLPTFKNLIYKDYDVTVNSIGDLIITTKPGAQIVDPISGEVIPDQSTLPIMYNAGNIADVKMSDISKFIDYNKPIKRR